MYRAIGLAANRAGIAVNDAAGLEDLAQRARIEFLPGDPARVILDGEDITDRIRTPEISMAASHVSAIPAVRRTLVKLQQELGKRAGGVLEGRDIGTKVFPDTPHKFFLTARPEVRAARRFRELKDKGIDVDFHDVLGDTTLRDRQDSTRADSPLKYDESYTIIDTSDVSIDEVVQRIVDSVRAKSSELRAQSSEEKGGSGSSGL